jgi:hypothetical protein
MSLCMDKELIAENCLKFADRFSSYLMDYDEVGNKTY